MPDSHAELPIVVKTVSLLIPVLLGIGAGLLIFLGLSFVNIDWTLVTVLSVTLGIMLTVYLLERRTFLKFIKK